MSCYNNKQDLTSTSEIIFEISLFASTRVVGECFDETEDADDMLFLSTVSVTGTATVNCKTTEKVTAGAKL